MSGLRSFHVQWRSVYQDLSRKLLYILWMEEILHQLVDGVDGVSRFDPIICTVLKLPIVKVTNWCGISSIHSSLDDIRSRIPAYLISLIQDSWTVSWWGIACFFPPIPWSLSILFSYLLLLLVVQLLSHIISCSPASPASVLTFTPGPSTRLVVQIHSLQSLLGKQGLHQPSEVHSPFNIPHSTHFNTAALNE